MTYKMSADLVGTPEIPVADEGRIAMLFQVSLHAVDQYLDRFLGIHKPYSATQRKFGLCKLEELVKDASRISKTDYVRPRPYTKTEVWAGQDWSGKKIYLFVDKGEVVTILSDKEYTTRHKIVDGKRRLVSKRPRDGEVLHIPRCPLSSRVRSNTGRKNGR